MLHHLITAFLFLAICACIWQWFIVPSIRELWQGLKELRKDAEAKRIASIKYTTRASLDGWNMYHNNNKQD